MVQWLFLVPLKGGRWHIIPQLAVYATYIPLIYCLLGGYIIPTTYYQNQNNSMNGGKSYSLFWDDNFSGVKLRRLRVKVIFHGLTIDLSYHSNGRRTCVFRPKKTGDCDFFQRKHQVGLELIFPGRVIYSDLSRRLAASCTVVIGRESGPKMTQECRF